VLVQNSVGAVLSDVATVTVAVPPTVSVVASDASGSEPTGDSGEFTFTRTGSTASPLAVNFAVSGTAAPDVDYVALSSPAVIPAGASSATMAVAVLDDSTLEGNETVIVTLTGGFNQMVGSPASATVTIFDDDNLPPSVSLTSPVDGLLVSFPANIQLSAIASDPDGGVLFVEFFDNATNRIAQMISPPYNLTWTNAAPGTHVLTAVATDNLGSTRASAGVTIIVNAPPSVAITSPSNGLQAKANKIQNCKLDNYYEISCTTTVFKVNQENCAGITSTSYRYRGSEKDRISHGCVTRLPSPSF
jgi:hypothetical protein